MTKPAPYLAPSLRRLRREVDLRWKHRKQAKGYTPFQDAWLGDAAHAARNSEHNPDPLSKPPMCVDAVDIAVAGIKPAEVLDRLIGDPRVWYVIYDHHIRSATHGWVKTPYHGADPHTEHIHVSIHPTKKARRSTRGFGLASVLFPKRRLHVVARLAKRRRARGQE